MATTAAAILAALAARPGATTAELAETAGIGKSTAARVLAALEADGQAARLAGGRDASGHRQPDRWTLPATGDHAHEQPAGTAAPPAATGTPPSQPDVPLDAPANVPATSTFGDAASGGAATTGGAAAETTDSASARLRPGRLREQVRAFLVERPGQSFSPTAIAKALDGRSAGAVANALVTLTEQGLAVRTSATPRRYAAAEPAGQETTSHAT